MSTLAAAARRFDSTRNWKGSSAKAVPAQAIKTVQVDNRGSLIWLDPGIEAVGAATDCVKQITIGSEPVRQMVRLGPSTNASQARFPSRGAARRLSCPCTGDVPDDREQTPKATASCPTVISSTRGVGSRVCGISFRKRQPPTGPYCSRWTSERATPNGSLAVAFGDNNHRHDFASSIRLRFHDSKAKMGPFVSANESRNTIEVSCVAEGAKKQRRWVYHVVKETVIATEAGKAIGVKDIPKGALLFMTISVEDPNTVIRIELIERDQPNTAPDDE
jgi:hypothetical protein